jgi:hypothetical protein
MRRVTVMGSGGGAHAIVDAAACPACRHPLRLHNAVGCVRAECECALDRDGLAQPLDVPPPPSGAALDRLDPPCAACPHRRGSHVVSGTGLPCQRCGCRSFAPEVPDASSAPPPGSVAGDLGPAPAGPAAEAEAAPEMPAAGATARAGFGLKAPRRQNPRPATDRALDVAVVGGDDAGEEVAAAVGAPAATSVEQAAAVPRAVAALDDAAALVEQVVQSALFYSNRSYCGSCVAWWSDPGACPVCNAPLQPVYLATLPRSLT